MSDGKLKEAISGDWEKAMKPPTILNRGIGIDELQEMAERTNSAIEIIARPDKLVVNVVRLPDD